MFDIFRRRTCVQQRKSQGNKRRYIYLLGLNSFLFESMLYDFGWFYSFFPFFWVGGVGGWGIVDGLFLTGGSGESGVWRGLQRQRGTCQDLHRQRCQRRWAQGWGIREATHVCDFITASEEPCARFVSQHSSSHHAHRSRCITCFSPYTPQQHTSVVDFSQGTNFTCHLDLFSLLSLCLFIYFLVWSTWGPSGREVLQEHWPLIILMMSAASIFLCKMWPWNVSMIMFWWISVVAE